MRKNEIHGEDEIQIVLNETFEINQSEFEETEQSGSMVVQDRLSYRYCYFVKASNQIMLPTYPLASRLQDDAGTLFDSEIPAPSSGRGYEAMMPSSTSQKPDSSASNLGSATSVMTFKHLGLGNQLGSLDCSG